MFPKSKTNVKKQRPAWWSPEGVIDRLQNGEFVVQICQAAADDMWGAGITISTARLRAEISGWEESASWGEQLKAALKLWRKSSAGEMVLSKAWHDDFIAAMETEQCAGDAELAAKMAGVGHGMVLAVLDSRNKCYDADFAERFRIAELERVGRIRSKYMATAEDVAGDGGKLAFHAQERVIEAALPSLHGRQQEVHVSGKVKHDHAHAHEHLHGMAPGMARELVIASQDRMRKIQASRQGLVALPESSAEAEGRVIDVTPIAQRETVPA